MIRAFITSKNKPSVITVTGIRNGNILVGAPAGGVLSNVLGGLQVKAGQVHVFKKKTAGFTSPVTSDQVIASPRANSILSILAGQTINLSVLFGSSMDNMLDVNCDGINDIIVGEPMSTNVPLLGANGAGGAAYIFLGTANGLYNEAAFWDFNVTVSPLLGVNATSLIGYSVAGARYVRGRAQGVRSLIGGPSNTLDFGAGLLNLGNTLGVTFDFAFDDNGLGKAYSFPYISCNISLPAVMLDFKGTKKNKTVDLDWTTLSEDNVNHFELQRSNNGVAYETIALIFSKGTGGSDYMYPDKDPFTNINYYRLRIVDRDEKFEYSKIITVRFDDNTQEKVVITPNPVKNDINIRMTGLEKGTYHIELMNAVGQRFINKSVNVNQFVQTETFARKSGMASGLYWVNIYNEEGRKVQSLKIILDR